ncbi:MAG: Na(+)/H(+) antiporter subunit B, partial [Paracoccaceae bacterium]
MRLDTILRITAKLFIPFIFVFGLYVQFHGDFGPGGGFQAGVILAASVILYAIVYGLDAAQRVVPVRVVEVMVPLGVLIFAGVGVAGLLTGGNYLDYDGL